MDVFNKQKRSEVMSNIGPVDTKPELIVRKSLFREGFRFRLHDKKLPGRPDIVLKKHHTVVNVHGCFWHLHGCKDSKIPKTNTEFWETKLKRNVERLKTFVTRRFGLQPFGLLGNFDFAHEDCAPVLVTPDELPSSIISDNPQDSEDFNTAVAHAFLNRSLS